MTLSQQAEWVQTRLRHANPQFVMTDDEARLVDTLCVIAQPYNLQIAGSGEPDGGFEFHRAVRGLRVRYKADLATFDMDHLTRLVVAAQRNSISVQINPWAFGSFQIWLHCREPEDERAWGRHPGADSLPDEIVDPTGALSTARAEAAMLRDELVQVVAAINAHTVDVSRIGKSRSELIRSISNRALRVASGEPVIAAPRWTADEIRERFHIPNEPPIFDV